MEQLNSTVVTSNISSSPGLPPPVSWDSSKLVPAVVLSLCFLLGVPGNVSVIIRRPNWQHLSRLTQILMLNLAMSDILSLLPLPLWIYSFIYSWIFGLVACKLVTYLEYCSLYCSLLTVTVLSVQRYLQVVHLQVVSLQRCLHQVGKWLLVVLWLVAMALSTHALVVRQITTDQHRTLCQSQYSSRPQQMAVLLSESLVGCVSCCILAFSYICLHRNVKQTAFFNNPQTTRLLTSIIVAFFVLWMPNFIINLLCVAAISLKNEDLFNFCLESWNIVLTLPFLNSCLNPLLYAFASRNMCSACQKN
ncbi:C-C chemokine receptor type 4 [Lates calcarifer]|uniref:C-C chemokine receptor type 4 n=1 Tax=Lates calcarifer TaxID=8187 RepID=A0AAJ7QB35_LATCA|nr:C-C chemokine receptor type 4 [Lates calcarifer]